MNAPNGSSLSVDLVCIYVPEAGAELLRTGNATIINPDPDFLVTNNNPRRRTVPVSPGVQYRDATPDASGACVEGPLLSGFDHGQYVAWFNIVGGQATYVVWGCEMSGARVNGSSPGASPGQVFPYSHFREVPQLGREPVRGSGCGSDGSIDDLIPDGLWAAFVNEPNGSTLSVDLVCVYMPQAGAELLRTGNATIINADPDFVVVNNSTRRRTVATSANTQYRDAIEDGNGRCVEGPFLGGVEHAQYLAWVNIVSGRASYVMWGCDYYAG